MGIVARADLMRALANVLAAHPTLNSDAQIKEAILIELAKRSWSNNGSIGVAVKDGIVELSGNVFDERERVAARVAAENIPGVKSVKDEIEWIDPNYGVAIPLP